MSRLCHRHSSRLLPKDQAISGGCCMMLMGLLTSKMMTMMSNYLPTVTGVSYVSLMEIDWVSVTLGRLEDELLLMILNWHEVFLLPFDATLGSEIKVSFNQIA